MDDHPQRQFLDPANYTVVWIAPLPVEAKACFGVLDVIHEGDFETYPGQDYLFSGGSLNGHNIIIATFPYGQNYGTVSAAALFNQVKLIFPTKLVLLVGIAAGLPRLDPTGSEKKRDIRLGDVLVAVPENLGSGVVAYDSGTHTNAEFEISFRQAESISIVRAAYGHIGLHDPDPFAEGRPFATYLRDLQRKLKVKYPKDNFERPPCWQDVLYTYIDDNDLVGRPVEREPRSQPERPEIWLGSIGSGNKLMRNDRDRDRLRDKYDFIGLEMEAAGVINSSQAAVIRGVCDYGDKKKNKAWQAYAAAVAAVYAKGVLMRINPINMRKALSPVPDQLAGSTSPEMSERASEVFIAHSEYVDHPNSEARYQHRAMKGDSEGSLIQPLTYTGQDSGSTDVMGYKDELAKSNFRPQDEDMESRFSFRVSREDVRREGKVYLEDLVRRVIGTSNSTGENFEDRKCVALLRNGRRCACLLPSSDRKLAASLLQIISAISDEVISLDLLRAYISINLCGRIHRDGINFREIPLTLLAQQLQDMVRQEILGQRSAMSFSSLHSHGLRERFNEILHDFPRKSGQAVALVLKVLLGITGKGMLSLRFIQKFLRFMVNQGIIRKNEGLNQILLPLSALKLLPGIIEIKGDSRDPTNCQICYNHSQLHDLMTSSWWFQDTWPPLFTGAYQEAHWERLCNEQLAEFEGRKAESARPTPSILDEGYISHEPTSDVQERPFSLAIDSGFQDHGSNSYGTRPMYERYGANEIDPRSEEDSGPSSAVNRVIRSDEDIGSRKGYDRNPIILAAEKHLQACFAADEQLASLLRQVSTSMAEKYLEADIRELLKYHHLDLKKLASTNLEHAAANLLRSHWYRQRIAVALVDSLNGRNSEIDDAEGQGPNETNGTAGSTYYLNRWLQDNLGFNEAPPAHHYEYDVTSADLAHDEEAQEEIERDDSTNGELDDNDVESFAADDYVRRMERFIFGGVPFRKLLERVQIYTINTEYTALRCTLMTLPDQNINFNFESNANWFDRLRSNFERHCTMKCNWWPLAPPSLAVRHDHCRVFWKCHCGSGHYEDVPEQDARRLQQLIRLRSLPLSEDHLCLKRKRMRRGWSHFWPVLVEKMLTALVVKYQTVMSVPTRVHSQGQATTASPSTGTIHSTTSNPVSASALTQQTPLTTRPGSMPNSSMPSVSSQQSTSTVSMPSGDRSLILLGVKVKRWTLRIKQIDTRDRGPKHDGDVIDRLLESYESARGSLRLWLSVKQLETLHFRQFFKHRQNRVNAGCEGIPESNVDYEYRSGEQIPPNARRPPIRPDEFCDHLNACATPCYYWIFPGHECNLPSQEHRLLDCIPKKKSFWALDCAGTDEAWGLDCIYDLSISRIVAYHILMFCGTFVFWVWWQAQHPDDLQTAAVPVTVLLSLISAFWSSTGVLNQASDRLA